MPPAFGVGVLPAQLRVASPGTRRPRDACTSTTASAVWLPESLRRIFFRYTLERLLPLAYLSFFLPGLEKCCGLTPPFDDLARPMQRSSRRPFATGETAAPVTASWLKKGKVGCAQSFAIMKLSMHTDAQKRKSPPRGAGDRKAHRAKL